MIKFFKEKFNMVRYRRILKRHFEPSQDFLKESKILFLQKLREEKVVTKKESIRIPVQRVVLKYGLAGVLAILMFGAGSIIYAEKQNVSPDNPLYEFKKLGESIQIKLAAEEEKPLLHKEFAERRLEEIKFLKLETPEPQKENVQNNGNSEPLNQQQATISNLEEDFHKEVNAILKEVKAPEQPPKSPESTEPKVEPEETDKNKNLCESISKIVEKHEEITPGDKEEWHEFNEKCHKFLEEKLKQQKENNKNEENEED